MLAIDFYFPGGSYHATPWGHHVNEALVEWPPSPWRILRALISVWKLCKANVSDEEMVALLDKLATPPVYCLPPSSQAHTRHYMPWTKNWKAGAEGEAARTLVFDSFMALDPKTPLTVTWPKAELNDTEYGLLQELLYNLNYLGRAESWCVASLRNDPPEPNCVPMEEHGQEIHDPILLLLPERPVELEKLCRRTADLRREGYLDPPGAAWVPYTITDDPNAARRPRYTSLRKVESVEVCLYALSGPVLPMITETLPLAELARSALQAQYGRITDGAASPNFSGKDENGSPLEGHRHAFFLPLDEDRDGRIDHLLVYSEGGFTEKEQEAMGRLNDLRSPGGHYNIGLALLRLGSRENLSLSVFSDCRIWVSSTPFMLVRHPRRGKDMPQDQVMLELERHGLPEPKGIDYADCIVRGRRINWLDFRRFRKYRRPALGNAYGFRIEFPGDVRGPIAIGYACHHGLGQFIPAR